MNLNVKNEAFTTHGYLRSRWDRQGRKLASAASGKADWNAWRKEAADKLRELSGYDTMISCPLDSIISEELDLGDHIRQRIVIQTEPDIRMPLFVLVPKSAAGPYPAVIAPHGHVSGGKVAVAGIRDVPEVAATIESHNYDYGLQFVRAGFIVFCPDARGFGERLERFERSDPMSCSCRTINNMALPLGQTVTGMWAWDIHRLIDYIETRSDCIPHRIGCAGLSGGGMQTLWASALDERIRCAIISGYMYGYKQSLLDDALNCSCNYVPHLYEYVDMGDIAALIAPRPLLIETGDADPLNGFDGIDNVMPQIATIRSAYKLFDAEESMAHDVFEGGHRWNGMQAIRWMERHL